MPPPQGAVRPSTDIVVNPIDGVAMTAADAPSDTLAKLVTILREREKNYRDWRAVAERELVARLEAEGHRRATVGDYELSVSSGNARVWDPDELEQTLRELVDRGRLQASELTELIRHETIVDGRQAQRLLESLSGPLRAQLERCFRWERKGNPRLTVTPSIPLIGDREEHAS